jgi:hypothetical protein
MRLCFYYCLYFCTYTFMAHVILFLAVLGFELRSFMSRITLIFFFLVLLGF